MNRGVPQELVTYINRGIPCPDFSFFLDVRPQVLLQRLKARDGEKLKFEESAETAINNIREAFLSLQPHLRLLDGELPQEQVTAKMVEIIDAARSMHT